jgi:hypothetical protein
VQRNGDVEEFMRVVCGFLKRKTSFMSTEGAEKKLMKVIREFQPKSKVRQAIPAPPGDQPRRRPSCLANPCLPFHL